MDSDLNLLTIGDVCRRNQISKSQLYRLIAQGKIEARKIGSATRITAEAERAWIDNLAAKGAAR